MNVVFPDLCELEWQLLWLYRRVIIYMDDLQLNFLPLEDQGQLFSVYRKQVDDSSVPKDDDDYRVNLPMNKGDDKWVLYDVSLAGKNVYEKFECEFSLNPVLTTHVIFSKFRLLLEESQRDEFYTPDKKAIARKEICFRFKEYNEGFSEIVVSPYFLRDKLLFGFLFEHQFSSKKNQSFNRRTQILSFSLDSSGRPNVYFYKDKFKEKRGRRDLFLYS